MEMISIVIKSINNFKILMVNQDKESNYLSIFRKLNLNSKPFYPVNP